MAMRVAAAFTLRTSIPLLLVLLAFSSFSEPPLCSAQGSLASDALALLDFVSNLTVVSFSSRALLSSWNISASPSICSTWVGVSCSTVSSQQRVSTLHLPGKSLYGRIAAHTISRLDALDSLSLRSNHLFGSLPADFANLTTLRKLTLQRNYLTGALPSDFSQWPLLVVLDLSYNSFSGSIPSSLNGLTDLRILYLQNNLLSGALPPLDHVASLDSFNVSNNNLNGSIPDSLQRFPSSSFAGNANLCGRPLTNCISPSRHKRSKTLIAGIILIAVAGAVLLLVPLVSLCNWAVKRRRARRPTTRSRSTGRNGRAERISSPGVQLPLGEAIREPSTALQEGQEANKLVFTDGKPLFNLDDLLQASAEVLGKGKLGTSYKAVLENGTIVAVKRLHDLDEGRREEYRNALDAIGRVRHNNVVPLKAYYVGKDENLLVYDFMQNGSLSALLHGSRSAGLNPIDWDTRLRIASTTAAGLAAIHAHNVVHGNIKSSNVLLKSNLEGCVTDYGISPMLFSAAVPPKSVGYVAPEVTDLRQITTKSDVFGYGVLLLELLTGKVPLVRNLPASHQPSTSSASPGRPGLAIGTSSDGEPVDLPSWVQSVPREQWMTQVFDRFLIDSSQASNAEEMVHLLQVALSCVAPSPDQRPEMPNVVQTINSIRPSTDEDKSSDLSPRRYFASTSERP